MSRECVRRIGGFPERQSCLARPTIAAGPLLRPEPITAHSHLAAGAALLRGPAAVRRAANTHARARRALWPIPTGRSVLWSAHAAGSAAGTASTRRPASTQDNLPNPPPSRMASMDHQANIPANRTDSMLHRASIQGNPTDSTPSRASTRNLGIRSRNNLATRRHTSAARGATPAS